MTSVSFDSPYDLKRARKAALIDDDTNTLMRVSRRSDSPPSIADYPLFGLFDRVVSMEAAPNNMPPDL
jgi:hypothetical protein